MGFPNGGGGGGAPPWEKFPHFPVSFLGERPSQESGFLGQPVAHAGVSPTAVSNQSAPVKHQVTIP